MKSNENSRDKVAKKTYRKPAVESRKLKLGVYGSYGKNDDAGNRQGGGGHGGGRSGGGRGHRR